MQRLVFLLVLLAPLFAHSTQITTKQIADGAVTNPKVNDVSVSKITSAATAFFTYKPNNIACTEAQTLAWDNTNARWACSSAGTGTVVSVGANGGLTGGPITTSGTLSIAALGVTDAKINDVSVSKVTSSAGAYFTYKPNNVPCTNGQTLAWDNTNSWWACTSAGSGTVTLVATGSTLTGGPITTAGTLDVASGGITSTELAALAVTDAKVNDVTVGKITSAASSYFTYQPNNVVCEFGQVLAYDGTTNGKRWHCQNQFNNNLVADSGAENRSTGTSTAWNVAGATSTLTVTTSGTNLLVGKASLAWDSTASGQILRSAVFNYTNGYTGKQGMLRCLFATPTGTATHTLDLIADQTPFNILTSVAIPSSATPTYLTKYFTFPATAGTMQMQITSVAANEPLIAIDDCYIGPAQDFSTTGNNTGVYLSYKPNNVACSSNQILAYDNTNDRWACGYPTTAKSITSTYGAANTDDTLIASGASFTITLPTAVGITGKRFTIQHAGTSLTQVYTLATTSSQTIGGVASGSYALYTFGESLTIVSDGFNWQIVSHQATTEWANNGAITLTGTTSNPTKGTTTVDQFYWRRNGKNMEFRIEYRQTAVTGAAPGSGLYLWALPANISIDTTKIITNGASATVAAGSVLASGFISNNADDLSNFTSLGFVIAYDATRLFLRYQSALSSADGRGASLVNSTNFSLAANNLHFYMTGFVPISGWQP